MLRNFKRIKVLYGVVTILVMLRIVFVSWGSKSVKQKNHSALISVNSSKEKIKILLWNTFFSNQDFMFGLDNNSFLQRGCQYTNCQLIQNKNSQINEYDAVIFHQMKKDDALIASEGRDMNQVFVFLNLESPVNILFHKSFEFFFNLTITYEFDADIMWSYMRFVNANGDTVAPNIEPRWIEPARKTTKNESLRNILRGKNKKVAWFVSNCSASNGRMNYVKKLKEYIEVDVYGSCGDKDCDRSDEQKCSFMLSKHYYFYLSFENSNCVDYVTEKVYQAMAYDTVPVVYGGANYSRFLPPDSYIDANVLEPKVLALYLLSYVNAVSSYEELFWWRDHYTIVLQSRYDTYLNNNTHPFCELCKVLNNSNRQYRTYGNMESVVGAQKSKCTPAS